MCSNSLLNLCNTIRTNKQNKCSIVKTKFSKKCVEVLSVLLKEGYVRGYFLEVSNNTKTICILLKYINDNDLLRFKKISVVKYKTYFSNNDLKNQSIGFNLSVISTQKGIMASTDAIKLGLGGFVLINIT